MSSKRNPLGDEAVWQHRNQRTKKKKARPIEGRNVQDAYFQKKISESKKPPLQQVCDNLLSILPEEMQMNIRSACRSFRKALSQKQDKS
eukprot:g3863.t1